METVEMSFCDMERVWIWSKVGTSYRINCPLKHPGLGHVTPIMMIIIKEHTYLESPTTRRADCKAAQLTDTPPAWFTKFLPIRSRRMMGYIYKYEGNEFFDFFYFYTMISSIIFSYQ